MASQIAPKIDLGRERQLVEAAQAGNLDALRPLLEEYAPLLYSSIVYPRIADRAAAEDILKDTMVTALTKIAKFRWRDAGLYPWLRRIAINKTLDVHRKRTRQRKLLQDFALEHPKSTPKDQRADAQLIAAQDRKHNRERIATVLERLHPRYRQAIELRLIEEYPRERCAELMTITVGNFDVVLFRAIRAFRKAFGSRDDQKGARDD